MREELEFLLEEYCVTLSPILLKSIEDFEEHCNTIDYDIYAGDLDASIGAAESDGEIPRQLAYELRRIYLQ